MHHGQHPDTIGSDDIDDGVRKGPAKMAPRLWWSVDAEQRRLSHDFRDQAVNMAEKSATQLRLDREICRNARIKSASASG